MTADILPAPSACPLTRLARRRRKVARPQELLDAALTLFIEKGLAGARADDVAKLAGVSKGTLYLYYPSKDELFKAVVRAHLTQVIVEGGDLVDQYEGSSSELLQALAQTWWSRVGQSKAAGIIKLIVAEAANFPDLAQFYMDEVVEPCHRLLGRAVQRGIDRVNFAPWTCPRSSWPWSRPFSFWSCINNAPMPAPPTPSRWTQTPSSEPRSSCSYEALKHAKPPRPRDLAQRFLNTSTKTTPQRAAQSL